MKDFFCTMNTLLNLNGATVIWGYKQLALYKLQNCLKFTDVPTKAFTTSLQSNLSLNLGKL